MNDFATLSLEEILERIKKTFAVHFEEISIDTFTLDILEIDNMQQHLNSLLHKNALHNPLHDLPLWAKVWPGSFVLGRLLRKYEPEQKSLLELGCGCGLVSLIAAHYPFASITCTDINTDALLFAKANVLKNNLSDKITVEALDIKAPSPTHAHLPQYDIIAASELLYLPELHEPVCTFVEKHLKKDGVALFATDIARKQKYFTKRAGKHFHVTEGHIGVKTNAEDGSEERRIYVITILTK